MKRTKIRLDAGETWKRRAVEMTERFQTAQSWIARMKSVLYDAATGKLVFLGRTNGEYASEFGSLWYRAQDGSILEVDYDAREITMYSDMADVLRLYSSFQAEHNVAAYREIQKFAA